MRFILISLLYIVSFNSIAQGINNLWMMGYANYSTLPFGGNTINFNTGSAVISYAPREMNFSRTSANITNSQGNLLFSTNGIYIANRNGAQMENGAGLNPGQWAQDHALEGLAIFQAALILPKPGSSSIYYLFHNTLDEPNFNSATQLYLTTIDMQLNGGLGVVTAKNQPIIADEINPGQITAVKHGNGRDWWLFCHKVNTNTYYRLLVSPDGVSGPFQQSIGPGRGLSGGQAVFSPNGNRFAYYYADHGLDIMDFDRCSGLMSNPVHFMVNDSTFNGGVGFSPNSQVLYVASTYFVYQFDLTAANINASRQTVAVWDGWHEPNEPILSTLFEKCQLAPDGKIYISTGNGTRFLHVINEPDVLGSGCNLVQRGAELPTYYFNSLPNHPNYHLGPLAGSPCDSLVSVAEGPLQTLPVQIYPNPNNGDFSINFAPQPEQGVLQVYDVLGNEVYKEEIAAWSQLKRLSQPELKAGVYHCRLSWKEKSGVVRFVKE